jgi:hypothetical protein
LLEKQLKEYFYLDLLEQVSFLESLC